MFDSPLPYHPAPSALNIKQKTPEVFSLEPVVSLRDSHQSWGELLNRLPVFPQTEEQWINWYLALPALVPIAIERHQVDTVSINVDSDHLLSRRIFETLENFRGLPVMFEWTENRKENVDTRELWAAARRLDHLRSEGFSIIFDDVGSGEDSLGRMCLITPDIVKIAGLLFQTARHNQRVYDILKGQIAFYANQGIPVVIEWIESTEDLRMAMDLGATWGQGYYWTKGAGAISETRAKAV